ncbi:MAG TPA: Lrp/AsnC family transcriptional regulator [Candidatus Sulfotelmatobacter sp.]|nr:Lrp/AsnC family transcriptional regulator [Candidatus Sulfotelmatobacter sp.]
MDNVDWQIMDMLLRDARKSYSEIGKVLGLGKDSIQKRVKKLQEQGILGTPIAILDARKCGFEGIVDFFIKADSELKDVETFEAQLAKLPYILTFARTLGDYNLYVSSFFRNFDDIREIVEVIKSNGNFSSFEMTIYRKDVSNPLIVPFVDGNPENSILYKIHTKYQQA